MTLLGDNAKRSKLFLLGFVPKLISESHFDAHTICFLFYNKPQWKHIWKIKKWRKFFPKIMLCIHDLALCGFWDLKKPALHKICVSGTVGGSLLKRKSPTCAYISQNLCQWDLRRWNRCMWGTPSILKLPAPEECYYCCELLCFRKLITKFSLVYWKLSAVQIRESTKIINFLLSCHFE